MARGPLEQNGSLKTKKDERGIVVRNKALVAQGYTQEEGINYDEVFAPVAMIEAIRLFLAYASFIGFIVYQMDVKSAFLYGTIEEESLVLSTYLIENGFRRGTIDKTLFIKKDKGDILLVQVYVDDIIFGSTKKSLCDEFEGLMHKRFQMSSMGELTFFLGLKIQQKEDGIFISQDKYVAEILKKFNFATVKTASTPIETNKALVKDEEAEAVDVHLYKSMIRSLIYLIASRPDIIFAVCACGRFQVTPKMSHLHAVKRIFKYLKGQPKLGLWYPRDSPFDFEAFSDSDYVGASLDRKSTTGGCQFIGKRLISWQCKKQTIVANFTTEAEYVAAANCCGHVLWIQNQMLDYGFNFMNTKIYIDNESTICIMKNLVFHSKTKHIEIRHHFIRDSYQKRLIQVIKIHTDHNVADLLTKAFDVSRFNFLVASIGLELKDKKELAIPGQMATGKEFSNPLMAGSLPKTISAKCDENAEFHQIVDFLSTCSINYAITVSPTIYASYIEQFWNIVTFKTVNSVKQMHAIVNGKAVVISESSVRNDLLFDDEDGITYLTNDDIFENLALKGNLDSKKFLMYPRFLQLFLNNKLKDLPKPFNDTYDTPSHTKKVFSNMARQSKGFSGKVTPLFDSMLVQNHAPEGEGSAIPPEPQPTPSISQPNVLEPQTAPLQTETPPTVSHEPQTKAHIEQILPSPSTYHRKHRKTQKHRRAKKVTELPQTSMPLDLGADETRSERVLEKPNEPPLPEGHTSGSGEGSMEYTFELMGIVPPTPHDSPLTGGYTPESDEGRLKLKELIAMCIKLSKQVLDLEKEKDAQAVKILKLKQRVKKLERNRKSSISHPRRRIYRQVESSDDDLDKENASKQERTSDKMKPMFKDRVSTAAPRTPTTITVFDDEDVTMAMAQTLIKMKEEKAKAKGVVIKDVEDSSKPIRSITTLQPLPTIDPKDKEHKKKKKQEEATNAALAEEFDEIQARMDADHELVKQLAAERAEAIRNKPPTRAQVRNGMIAYLKHMGKYTHQQLKHKTLEELRSYTKRSRSGLMIFRLWILKKMVAIQRKLAKG
ncbi:putative ribonuclease H-like domain-containing protein [Tanacetum coccineum]